ncbi:MAG: acyl carrier protein [Eubacteriaceae bacterium]|jgi:acyl carrier protein|nr:acyl carrier protein [Eubacteriaceae bacterium]
MDFEAVKNVIVETLNCDADAVKMNASLQEDLDADSLDAVELAMALEDEFGVTIADDKLGDMKTVADIFNYLKENAA